MHPGKDVRGGRRTVCSVDLELLGGGRSAQVYALDDERVLRRYFDGLDTTAEVAVMTYVRAHGVPVPRVISSAGSEMVMERVHGPTMVEALQSESLPLADAAGILADLHQRLHAVPSRTDDPAARVLHMDLHPLNVLISADGPVLIDWCNARDGAPDLDVAMSALILAEVAVPEGGLAAFARDLLAAFLTAVGGDPVSQLAEAVRIRSDNPTLSPGELESLPSAADLVRTIAGAR